MESKTNRHVRKNRIPESNVSHPARQEIFDWQAEFDGSMGIVIRARDFHKRFK